MARIPYHDLNDLPEKLAETIKKAPPLNIYRMLAHAPTVAPGFLKMGGAILTASELDPKLRELVILRVGILSDASYEIYQHRRVAASVGLDEKKVAAVLNETDEPVLDDLEQLLVRFTDSVVKDVKAPDELFNEVSEKLSPRLLSELLLTIGFYMMVSRFLENTGVDIEEKPAL
ncbi:MAG: carboxymuconolactone decarboxylase family protein [Methyloligellaceae bacterium]